MEIVLTEQEWDALKFSLVTIALLLAVIIAFLVFRYNRIIKGLKKSQETNQILVKKRIEALEKISPKLYDILSFYCYSGSWKEISPVDILQLKKELDKDISTNSPLFSEKVTESYSSFIRLCFVSSTGWEHKEQIKSLYELRQENNLEWKDEWLNLFDTKNVVDAIIMRERYNKLIESLKTDIQPE